MWLGVGLRGGGEGGSGCYDYECDCGCLGLFGSGEGVVGGLCFLWGFVTSGVVVIS